MMVVTGATGQLGRLVIESLLLTEPPTRIVAAVRDPAKAADLAARGVSVRQADYTRPDTLDSAFAGADKLLLISSNALGERATQHRSAIDAAARSGVRFIAYTSVLHADTSVLGMAAEHVETEAMLKQSGVPFVLLRNGWYNENHAASAPTAVQHGVLMGSAGTGRISSAARADYAAAAAAVLTRDGQAGRIYELAGDTSYTLAELAAEIATQSGKPVAYTDMPQADYEKALLGFGMPAPVAQLLASCDAGASQEALFDDSRQLSALIGRPTTPMREAVTALLNPR